MLISVVSRKNAICIENVMDSFWTSLHTVIKNVERNGWRQEWYVSFFNFNYTKMYLRGFTDFVALNSCNDVVSSHLIDHHLSRESVSERELILVRAGLLVITEEQMESMTVFPAYRYTLGKY